MIKLVAVFDLFTCLSRYVLWAPGEPKTFYRCVALDPRAGYWKTKNCLEWSGVLCKVALRMKALPSPK